MEHHHGSDFVHLVGYREYAAQVRYRLLLRIW